MYRSPIQNSANPSAKQPQANAAAGRCIRMPAKIATTGARPSTFMTGPLPAKGFTKR